MKAAIATLKRETNTTMLLKSPLKIKALILGVATLGAIVAVSGVRSLIRDLGCATGGIDGDTSRSNLRSSLITTPNIGPPSKNKRGQQKTQSREVVEVENLVLNPSFEGGTTSSWKTFGRSTLAVKSKSSAQHGAHVASATGTEEDWHGITQKIGSRLTEGVRYQVSAFVQVDSPNQSVKIAFSEGQDNSNDKDLIVVDETIDVPNEWKQLMGYYIASSSNDIKLYLKAPKGVKLLVDYVEVIEADCDFNTFVRDFNPNELEITCDNWDELEMGDELGRGRSRTVSEATWKGTKVAVKQPLNPGRPRSRRAEVMRVAALNNQLAKSDNIVKLIGMCDSSLVFEYAPTTLKSVVFDKEKELSVAKSLSLGLDIVKGLAQLHAIGPVVHGDLRISQYLVDPQGKVLLGDLESSRYVGPDRAGNKCTFWKKAGGKGTFNSPERLSENAELDEKTDIYRVALTLWTLFAREFPYFKEKDVKDLVLRGERPDLNKKLSGYPQEVKDLLEEAWDENPMKRPSADDMAKRMRSIVESYVPNKEEKNVAEKSLDEEEDSADEYGEESDSGDALAPKKAAKGTKGRTKKTAKEDSESDDSEYGEESDSGDAVAPKKASKSAYHYQEGCLNAKGPQPYILLTRGRSGSGSTWQIIGNLTGYETPNDRPTGGTAIQSKKFFNGKENDEWLHEILCTRQEAYPKAGIVGFKWKPFSEFFAPGGQAALQTIATVKKPQIKIVRNKRNMLDVIISSYKHKIYDSAITAQHCHVGDEECAQRAKEASMGLQLPTKKLLDKLRRDKADEDKIDEMLVEMNVPHVQVTYEELYYGKDGGVSEWMKIFKFLGIGPGEGLTKEQLHGAMEHVATNIPMHNVTLGNYEEVKKVLEGTEFEDLLH